MTSVLDSVTDLLAKKGIAFHQTEDGDIWFRANGDHGNWGVVVMPDQGMEMVFFHFVCPLKAPTDCRTRLAEFLMRANREAYMGAFLLDLDSGEMRYETYLPCRNAELEQVVIETAIETNIWMMDKYLPGIARIISTELPAADVFLEIQTGVRPDKKYLYN